MIFKHKKNTPTDDMPDLLGNISDVYIAQAAEVDTAEKLRALSKAGKGSSRVKIAIRVAAAALSLALIIGGANIISRLGGVKPEEEMEHGSSTPDPDEKPLVIDSIDKANYYGAMRILRYGSPDTSASLPSSSAYARASRVLDSEGDTAGGTPVYEGHDVSSEIFRITTSIFFLIDVTEEDEYLASKVGTGTVEVVVTDLTMGINPFAMITFKNGERFFSCLSESYALTDGKNTFDTFLFIKGFNLYKDISTGIYFFDLDIDLVNMQVNSLSWYEYNRRPADSVLYPISVREDSLLVSNQVYEFTLPELYEFYNGTPDKETEKETKDFDNETVETIPTTGIPFETTPNVGEPEMGTEPNPDYNGN